MRYILCLLVILAGCGDHKKSFPAAFPDMAYSNGHPLVLNTTDTDLLESELVEITNRVRSSNGLSGLAPNCGLSALARAHSAHMFIHSFYGHDNPEGFTPTDRLRLVVDDVPFVIHENVWMLGEPVTAQFIFDGFWNSPPHQAAILSNSQLIGVGMFHTTVNGVALLWVTMEFLELR